LAFAFLAVFIVFFRYAAFMAIPRHYLEFCWRYPYYFLIYNIYTPYYFGPLVEFNLNGTITWRLFIAPATGLLLIIWLIRIASQSQKKRNA
jgi:hypothetical protein